MLQVVVTWEEWARLFRAPIGGTGTRCVRTVHERLTSLLDQDARAGLAAIRPCGFLIRPQRERPTERLEWIEVGRG